MNLRAAFLTIATLCVACAVPVTAQESLGDMVAAGGYEWIIGRWAATSDDGQKIEFRYEWAVDQHAVLADVDMGSFVYRGLVMLAPEDGSIFDVGADNRGGLWKGTWSQGAAGPVHQVEHTAPDGQVRKAELVYEKMDADTITIALYGVDSSGSRNSEPLSKLTYKRQPAVAPRPAGGQASGSRDYQTLGDLVSEGGYEWLIGKWAATKEDRTYELEYKPVLDQHAAQADVKIGDFTYVGLIMYVPARQEITDIGADSRGGIWKGTWEQDGSDAADTLVYTRPDGTTVKIQHIYSKTDSDVMTVKEYSIETGGGRTSSPRDELTFKRQKTAAPTK
jgi:hypothetical protein